MAAASELEESVFQAAMAARIDGTRQLASTPVRPLTPPFPTTPPQVYARTVNRCIMQGPQPRLLHAVQRHMLGLMKARKRTTTTVTATMPCHEQQGAAAAMELVAAVAAPATRTPCLAVATLGRLL